MASTTAFEWSTPEEKYFESLGDSGDLLRTNKVEKHQLHTRGQLLRVHYIEVEEARHLREVLGWLGLERLHRMKLDKNPSDPSQDIITVEQQEHFWFMILQGAFVKTAAKILQNIQEGVIDASNEACGIKFGHGCQQGLSGGRDGTVSQRSGCCS
ncbi:hypothetical protein CRG98_009032 [Punica granatum]|uniref:Uncharacterized protein n=1 Tax=Punica granatum TaxID=22663 RepID=A0A2I0KPX3_PUNGR|nr:hypothetical protein CRG98_009032 [Punica granatum]